jgi:hypothetical protein
MTSQNDEIDGPYLVAFSCLLPYTTRIHEVEISVRASTNESEEARLNPERTGADLKELSKSH